MATGVTSWSTAAASNGSADININFAEGMAPSQVNDSARALMASVALYRNDMAGTLISSGSATALTVTSNQGFASLAALAGNTLVVRIGSTVGASPTLSVDSLAAKAIQIDSATAVTSGSMRANSIHHLTYDNSLGAFIVHHGHALIEPGRVIESALASAPPGWLLCDGTGYSQSTYADLFNNIGSVFGSTGAGMFSVPNRKGRTGIGVDPTNSAVTGSTAVGNTQGISAVTLTTGNLPSHTHGITDPMHLHASNVQSPAVFASGSNPSVHTADVGATNTTIVSSAATNITINNTGDGVAHNNMQPSITMNYFIKT